MHRWLAMIVSTGLLVGPAWACGEDPKLPPPIPPLNAALDELLPAAKLSAEDRARVESLRAEVVKLAADGKEAAARAVEEQAMKLLGIDKMWLACGPGTFMWMKRPS